MIRMSPEQFDDAVRAALDSIPPDFSPYLENVLVEVRDRPDRALLREHDVTEDLLGLYVGVPLEDKGVDGATVPMPDCILIFRDNLCRMCSSRDELIEEIRITVLHEIGHHFGMDEEDLEELGYD